MSANGRPGGLASSLSAAARRSHRRQKPRVCDVTRISITSAAFDAIKATLPVGSLAYQPPRTAQGDFFIWIERGWLNKLEALRQPGEDLSETILRLVAMEAGGRPRRQAAELFGAKTRPASRGG
jgi:hypothetical protein